MGKAVDVDRLKQKIRALGWSVQTGEGRDHLGSVYCWVHVQRPGDTGFVARADFLLCAMDLALAEVSRRRDTAQGFCIVCEGYFLPGTHGADTASKLIALAKAVAETRHPDPVAPIPAEADHDG